MDALREQDGLKTSNVHTITLKLYAFLHEGAKTAQHLRIYRKVLSKLVLQVLTKLNVLLERGRNACLRCDNQ